MHVLILGSGGREHALARSCLQSPLCHRVSVLPGNPGMALYDDIEVLGGSYSEQRALTWAKANQVDFTIVGPEVPLVEGIVDAFEAQRLKVWGPSQKAAELEGSKLASKELMAKARIPTARFFEFESAKDLETRLETLSWEGYVIKADALAAGKGVGVFSDKTDALKFGQDILDNPNFPVSSQKLLLEECLFGQEVSAFYLCDGTQCGELGFASDYKRLLDKNQGPNTGGMGAISPVPGLSSELKTEIKASCVEPLLKTMEAEGQRFRGFLFVGLMLTPSGPKVLEYNVRMGDPETQVLLPLMESDLLTALVDAHAGKAFEVKMKTQVGVHIVMAAQNYPGLVEPVRRGDSISINELPEDCEINFAGVSGEGAFLKTSGGRVLGVSAFDENLSLAQAKAYKAIQKVQFSGAQYRKDIGVVYA